MTKKIIIDTDIGDDIDDAFAIALAAALPQAEIVGITTVFRNTAARAQQVQALLNAAGVNAPVYAGEGVPIKEPVHPFDRDEETPPELSYPCQWDKSYDTPVREGAVDFLIDSAKRYGEELTVIAIGPLTNLARALQKNPSEMKKTGKIVCMGGSFYKYEPEWNVLCDPEATDIVYRSEIPFYAVGLDVTLQCALEADLLQAFRSSEKSVNRLLTLWLDRWFAYCGAEKSVMHDPLTVAVAYYDVCTFEKKYVQADLSGQRGAVLVSDRKKQGYSPVYVANSVDREGFYRIVRQALLGK